MTEIYDNIPEPKPERGSYRERFASAHDDENEVVIDKLEAARLSRYIETAEGIELDRLGERFGSVGDRSLRNDTQYKAYLKGLVSAFSSQGTKPALKNAIAIAIGADEDNIIIDEHFETLQFEVSVENHDTEFLGSVINEIAEITAPSVVQLGSPPIIINEGADLGLDAGETTVTDGPSGLGSGMLSLDGSHTLQ